jgi:hypothetical protein
MDDATHNFESDQTTVLEPDQGQGKARPGLAKDKFMAFVKHNKLVGQVRQTPMMYGLVVPLMFCVDEYNRIHEEKISRDQALSAIKNDNILPYDTMKRHFEKFRKVAR